MGYDSEAAVIEDTKATDFFFIKGPEAANGEGEGSGAVEDGKPVENGEPAENGEALEADAPAENGVAHEEAVPDSLPNEGAGDAVASEQPPAPVKLVEASNEPAAASGEAMETS